MLKTQLSLHFRAQICLAQSTRLQYQQGATCRPCGRTKSCSECVCFAYHSFANNLTLSTIQVKKNAYQELGDYPNSALSKAWHCSGSNTPRLSSGYRISGTHRAWTRALPNMRNSLERGIEVTETFGAISKNCESVGPSYGFSTERGKEPMPRLCCAHEF